MKMASWSSVSEHLVNPIGMSDQLKWNNQSEKSDSFYNTLNGLLTSIYAVINFNKQARMMIKSLKV